MITTYEILFYKRSEKGDSYKCIDSYVASFDPEHIDTVKDDLYKSYSQLNHGCTHIKIVPTYSMVLVDLELSIPPSECKVN